MQGSGLRAPSRIVNQACQSRNEPKPPYASFGGNPSRGRRCGPLSSPPVVHRATPRHADGVDPRAIADQLLDAYDSASTVDPIAATDPGFDSSAAYPVLDEVTAGG